MLKFKTEKSKIIANCLKAIIIALSYGNYMIYFKNKNYFSFQNKMNQASHRHDVVITLLGY
jgi:hypothetical protein